MSVGPESAMRVFLEHEMMQVSKYGLEKKSNKDNYANDWMVLVELMQCQLKSLSGFCARYVPSPFRLQCTRPDQRRQCRRDMQTLGKPRGTTLRPGMMLGGLRWRQRGRRLRKRDMLVSRVR
jgi:hypothetical protein